MGSWCATCGISRMPIREDQEVKALLIVKNGPQDGSTCYTDDWWKPVGVPIDVRYADYGNFELVNPDDSKAALLLEYLKDKATPMEQGENEYHDIPVVPSELTWEKVNEAIHEGRLKLGKDNYFKFEKYVAWFPIHPIVYEGLVKSYYSWGIRTEENLNTVESTAKRIADVVNSDVSEKMKSIMERIGGADEELDAVQESAVMKMLVVNEIRDELSTLFGRYSDIEHFINGKADEDTIKAGAEVVHLRASMSQLRIPFSPVTGLGGQSDVEDYSAHQALANAITQQAQVYLDYYKELWGEEE